MNKKINKTIIFFNDGDKKEYKDSLEPYVINDCVNFYHIRNTEGITESILIIIPLKDIKEINYIKYY